MPADLRRRIWLVALGLVLGPGPEGRAAPPLAIGQESGALQTTQVRLGPQRETSSVPFTVDDGGSIEVEVVAPVAGLVVRVLGGGGERLDERTAADFDASFLSFETPTEGNAASPTSRQLIRLPSLGAGFYRVVLEAREPLAEDITVTVSMRTDSPLVSTLQTMEREVRLGDPVVLMAHIVDAGTPVTGATVLVTIVGDDGVPAIVPLFDEARDAGGETGDGIYAASLVPNAPGTFSATAEIHGFTRAGLAFRRTPETEFVVRENLGDLELRVVDPGAGVDRDENGLFESLVLAVAVNIPARGRYHVFMQLRTADGQALLGTVEIDGHEGWRQVSVPFSAARLLATGADGPYDVASVELRDSGDDGAVRPPLRLTNAGQTPQFRLSEFEGFASAPQ